MTNEERLRLDRRIKNQRMQLAWWEEHCLQRARQHAIQQASYKKTRELLNKMQRENRELRKRLGEENPPTEYVRPDGTIGKVWAAMPLRRTA